MRRAAYETLARVAARIAPALAATGELTDGEAQVAASALVFGYFAALEQWHRDPDANPIADTLTHALQTLNHR